MKSFLFLAALTLGMTVQAQDIKEGETLQEITVKGSKVVQRVDGQTIYPTRQQLESSTNGYSLLSKLTLPHLRIDPVMHTVTALTNLGSVQVRINNVIASKEDLLALDMKAVEQIDYIDNPGVRYGEGVAYVVNIIVKHPVSGYDIGADLTNTLTAINGDETVFGKFNLGKSEFGVTYGLDYRNFKGTDYEERATYEMESGEKSHILRKQLDGQNKNLSHNILLTYSLSDSAYVFQSKLSARKDIQPHNVWTKMGGTTNYEEHSSSHTSSPALDLYFHRDFARHQSLTANAKVTIMPTPSKASRTRYGRRPSMRIA